MYIFGKFEAFCKRLEKVSIVQLQDPPSTTSFWWFCTLRIIVKSYYSRSHLTIDMTRLMLPTAFYYNLFFLFLMTTFCQSDKSYCKLWLLWRPQFYLHSWSLNLNASALNHCIRLRKSVRLNTYKYLAEPGICVISGCLDTFSF